MKKVNLSLVEQLVAVGNGGWRCGVGVTTLRGDGGYRFHSHGNDG